MTHLFDCHKSWKGKFVRLKSSGGFKVPLKWEVVDGSPNRFLKATEVEQALFTKVWAMFFSGKLVKNQMKVKKYYPLPSVAVRVGEGFVVVPAAQIGELNGIGLAPTCIPFLLFEPLPWNRMCRLLTLLFAVIQVKWPTYFHLTMSSRSCRQLPFKISVEPLLILIIPKPSCYVI